MALTDSPSYGVITSRRKQSGKALIAAASRWLSDRGMKKIRGPFSLNINDETGCLVEGFDTPPMVMMPHHKPYQGGLIEAAGLTKHKDLYAWRYSTDEAPARVRKAHDDIEAMPEVYSRHVEPKEMERDVRLVMDVYNDAWNDNWSFVPYTEAELAKSIGDAGFTIECQWRPNADKRAAVFIVARKA